MTKQLTRVTVTRQGSIFDGYSLVTEDGYPLDQALDILSVDGWRVIGDLPSVKGPAGQRAHVFIVRDLPAPDLPAVPTADQIKERQAARRSEDRALQKRLAELASAGDQYARDDTREPARLALRIARRVLR